ncbi:PREDICTED: nucleoside diphosphate kinase 7-like isoform X2 [Priapulus caudatus]|nr:PREDICTED: nucleoside diphosphate kinase 7-like isoform X2 [Priapulus caudatus]
MSAPDDTYAFLAEWYDSNASLIRKYQFIFYCEDGTVEMYDIKNRRTFLKRTGIDNVRPEHLYIGSTINVLSRQLTLTGYADQHTANKLSGRQEKTLAIIKPDGMIRIGEIITTIEKNGFKICAARMVRLKKNGAEKLYEKHSRTPFFDDLVQFMCSAQILILELMAENGVQKWQELLGPSDPAEAKVHASGSIRAQFGGCKLRNACHGPDSVTSAREELDLFDSGHVTESTVKCENCTCCVIKPHAVLAGLIGNIISDISSAGFTISAFQLFSLERASAEEFLEIYKGVMVEYNQMVMELTAGPCIAIEITGSPSVAQDFRELVGPSDPEIGRQLRPHTLRAKYGKDKIKNAIHCTDLPEDGILEVEYFFKILGLDH